MNQSDPSTGKPDSLGDAVARLVDSLLRVGVSFASLPLTLLPTESRRHFEDGGRDIGKGVASILRAVADQIEGSRNSEKS
jgi:hypothetical protein